MPHNILLTGASGYLGGDLLSRLPDAGLPEYGNLYALVRTTEQGEAVQKYGAQPLTFNVKDEAAVYQIIVAKKITVVYFLIDASTAESQPHFIKALSRVREETGHVVHFLHTTGAKVFSSHVGAPTNRRLFDDDLNLYQVQKSQKPALVAFESALNANNTTIEMAESTGVRSYVFVPCIVYGQSQSFGNTVSIQTTAVVKAAKAAGKVIRTDTDHPTWPVSHIADNSALYIELLRNILAEKNPDHGKNGYYLASSGSVAWDDLYEAFAAALAKRGIIKDATVGTADDATLDIIAKALDCPKEVVPVQIGGYCTLAARHGEKLGWKPYYDRMHILKASETEVELILDHLKD